jgi:hypothetical protein
MSDFLPINFDVCLLLNTNKIFCFSITSRLYMQRCLSKTESFFTFDMDKLPWSQGAPLNSFFGGAVSNFGWEF